MAKKGRKKFQRGDFVLAEVDGQEIRGRICNIMHRRARIDFSGSGWRFVTNLPLGMLRKEEV